MPLDDRDNVEMGEENRLRGPLRGAIEVMALLLLLAGSVAFWVRFSSIVYHSQANDTYSGMNNVTASSSATDSKDW